MVMRPGQPILIPAKGSFIAATLLVAACVKLVSWHWLLAMPDVLGLVLFFWCVHQPKRVGMGVAFLLGLVFDVHHTTLLGIHAITYASLALIAQLMARRLYWFGLWGQALQLLPVLILIKFMPIAMRGMLGVWDINWQVFIALTCEVLLWPLVCTLMFAPQRKAPEADRPIL